MDDDLARHSAIAAAIGEPARARMLYGLMDGHARTQHRAGGGGGRQPVDGERTCSALKAQRLVTMRVQGKHRYLQPGGR